MKKRFLNLLLTLVMAVNGICTFNVSAEEETFTEGYYTYIVKEGCAEITDVDESISGDITIPSELGGYTVTSIGEWAFSYCPRLINISIPNSITFIGDSVFAGCENLTNINISDSVTAIGEYLFSYCKSLTSIIVDENNLSYASIDGNFFSKDKTMLIQYAVGKSESSYIIPDGVTSIGDSAFSDCINLTNITIPDGVTYIGEGAFDDCENLTNITIPYGITSISTYAFWNCGSLTNINIPDGVTSIGRCAFAGCAGLINISIPNSVTHIDDDAFVGCDTLTTVYYSGSEEQWNAINIESENEPLTNANIIFNSTGDVEEAPEIITSFGSKVSEWAAPEIEIAFEKGLIPEIMVGYDLTQKVNRGEFASIALQLYETLIDESVELPENCAFTDINGDINEEAIKKAYETQIAAGMSENQYMPLEFINREQLATMLCRVIKKRWFNGWTLATDEEYHLDTTGVDAFADDIDISLWAKPSVYYMSKHGIIAGVGDNKFAPRMTPSQQHIADYASATREQALVLSLRIFNKSETGETNWQ